MGWFEPLPNPGILVRKKTILLLLGWVAQIAKAQSDEGRREVLTPPDFNIAQGRTVSI